MTRCKSRGLSWRKSEAKSWLEEYKSYQAIIVGKVAKRTKARRHQATIRRKYGEYKEEGY